jgi:hypothetical protein
MAITFGPAERAPHLPVNYLPAVLPLWHGAAQGPRGVALCDPVAGRALPPLAVTDQLAASPARLSAHLERHAPGMLAWLAPFAAPPPATGKPQRLRTIPPAGQGALVLIDQGIAFWHPRFRRDGRNAFASVVYLPPSGVVTPADVLDRRAIDRVATDIAQDAPRALKALAARFPHALIAATAALPEPDRAAFWHGTAVADTLVGADAADRAMIGVELPDLAGRDWSGGVLQALLPAAIDAALRLLPPGMPVTIVLPYAFTGGPQDGRHPGARVLTAMLARLGAERQLRLVVPAGNHRQDACCARHAAALAWHVPPDDHSANTLDVRGSWPADTPVTVTLTLPGEAPTTVGMADDTVVRLRRKSVTVAALHRHDGGLRIATMPTGWRTGLPAPAPFGLWHIALSPAGGAAWVLRDDRDPVADGALPRRQSWLVDPARRDINPDGGPVMDDDPDAQVVRAGTLSVLATATGADCAGALAVAGGRWDTASYSGLPVGGLEPALMIPTDDMAAPGGILALVNGGPGRARVSGTSLSAALAV